MEALSLCKSVVLKCHRWTNSVSITWEVVKNGDSQFPRWSTVSDTLNHSSKPYVCSTLNQPESHLPQGSVTSMPLSLTRYCFEMFRNFRNFGGGHVSPLSLGVHEEIYNKLDTILLSHCCSHAFQEIDSLRGSMQIVDCSLLHGRSQGRVSSWPRTLTSFCENLIYPKCTCSNPPPQIPWN